MYEIEGIVPEFDDLYGELEPTETIEGQMVLVGVGDKGDKGEDGKDGFSPIVEVIHDNGYTVLITDVNGTKEFHVSEGKDGYTPIKGIDYRDGIDGKDGVDGFSPNISVREISGGRYITIEDAEETKSFFIKDGKNGYTPQIYITNTVGGHVVTIEGEDRNYAFEVLNGQKGDKGDPGIVDYELINERISNSIADLVDSAPDTLDTLNELADALGKDPNFATTMAHELATKVDKVNGKGLSTNDLTNDLLSKLNNSASKRYVDENKVGIDKSLSVSGKAADAKETGDAISKLTSKKEFEDFKLYIMQMLSELKELIQNGNIQQAIAILDNAILDMARLG